MQPVWGGVGCGVPFPRVLRVEGVRKEFLQGAQTEVDCGLSPERAAARRGLVQLQNLSARLYEWPELRRRLTVQPACTHCQNQDKT